MTEITKSRDLAPYRWGTIFATLSLDLAAPYISDMQLQLPPRDPFITSLRKVIQEFRSLQALDPNANLPFSEAVFRWASGEYGANFVNHLYQWGENIFQCGNGVGASVFLWNNVVRLGGLDGSRDVTAPPDLIRVLRRELAEHPVPVVERIPRSPWDRELYERQGYDDLMNPMEMVRSTISYCNFMLAWRDAINAQPAVPNLDDTYIWGLAEAKRAGMPLDRLGKPGSWPPLPDLSGVLRGT